MTRIWPEALPSAWKKEGYLVTMCHDGEEGLYYMQEDLQDLVILDRMLPGLDGISVLRAARAAGVTTPVIFLTASGSFRTKSTGWTAARTTTW